MSYTEDELDGLTDEERAALEDAGDEDTTTTLEDSLKAAENAKTEVGDQQDGDAQEAGEAGDRERADDDQAQADAAASGAGGDDAGDAGSNDGKQATAQTVALQPAPLLVAEAPADAEAQLQAIGTQKDALTDKFDNGDITAKEFQRELDTLNKQERGIERAVEKYQLAQEMRQQQEANAWLGMANHFITTTQPEYSTSKVRHNALDGFIKEIGTAPENSHLSGQQILELAHKRVIDDIGPAASSKATATHKPLKGSTAAPPRTLGKVPAAESNSVEDGKYAALDRLMSTDPVGFEDKMARMSDAERDAYLAR